MLPRGPHPIFGSGEPKASYPTISFRFPTLALPHFPASAVHIPLTLPCPSLPLEEGTDRVTLLILPLQPYRLRTELAQHTILLLLIPQFFR